MAGIKRKSVEQKKIDGTYRHNQDAQQEIVEKKIQEFSITDISSVNIPAEIKDPELINQYKDQLQQLINYKLIVSSDLIEFNQIYILAQQLKDLYKKLNSQNINTVKGFEAYKSITYVILKVSARLSEIAKKYFISPQARAKLTIDQLDINIKSSQETKNKSVINQLIDRAKAD